MFIVGKVLKPKGLNGEVKVEIITSFPEHFETLKTVFWQKDSRWIPLSIRKVSLSRGFAFLQFAEIATIEQAERLRNAYLYIEEADLQPLAEDEFYVHDLLGMRVFDEENREIGEIVDVESHTSNDIYIVQSKQGARFMIPAIKDVVKQVDPRNKTMHIHVIEGLLD